MILFYSDESDNFARTSNISVIKSNWNANNAKINLCLTSYTTMKCSKISYKNPLFRLLLLKSLPNNSRQKTIQKHRVHSKLPMANDLSTSAKHSSSAPIAFNLISCRFFLLQENRLITGNKSNMESENILLKDKIIKNQNEKCRLENFPLIYNSGSRLDGLLLQLLGK